MKPDTVISESYVATRNACKLCSPLGASLAFKGVENCIPVVHGSQGCATYIRRYLISHFREPVDIASTNFSEEAAIHGGEKNLHNALDNIISQYKPGIIGIATTCLSETIGDDMQKLLRDYLRKRTGMLDIPELLHVNSPAYKGTHASGFHDTVLALVRKFAIAGQLNNKITLFPGLLSPEDIRHLKEICADYRINPVILPDYSETLDYGYTGSYTGMPEGGTKLSDIVATGAAKASVEFGSILNAASGSSESAGKYLERAHSIPLFRVPIPIGINACDTFFGIVEKVSGSKLLPKYQKQRERLLDAYIDAHKYTYGKKAVIYGEEDFVISMASFLEETGIEVRMCATGTKGVKLEKEINTILKPRHELLVSEGIDFESIASYCNEEKPDIIIGNSKGYYISRELDIPIVRVGFPVHDRFGSQRIRHIGYEGTQELFDRIVNALIERRQIESVVGYKYM